MKYLIPFLLVFASCQLVPSNRTDTTSLTASESIANQQQQTIKSIMETQKPPPVRIDFGTNSVEVAQAYRHEIELTGSGSTSAGASSASSFLKKNSLPIGISMLLAAAGAVAIFAAIKYARKQSAAFNAGFTAVDQTFANKIRNIRERAMVSTDHTEISRFNAEIATLESERARVRLN